jgi:Zn-dependent M28 family amino/carboxypeptidase
MKVFRTSVVGSLTAVLASCGGDAQLEAALDTITADELAADIRVLASDAFEGRAPASAGEDSTINYLKARFEAVGASPGNGDSYFQEVPLVSITADPNMTLQVSGAGSVMRFGYADEFVAWTKRVVDSERIRNSELVFVGYGIVAPENDWNDYEGLDVAGKTVVILVNDPGFATQDPELFNGNTMTYYGRWTYKFEEAARQGAAGAFVVHETAPASYPWATVRNSWTGPQFTLVAEDNNMSRVAVEGWISHETAGSIFERVGLDYDSLKAAAEQPGFRGVSLGLDASVSLQNTVVRSSSNNVLALVPGSDRADEYIVFTAHWDHFGRNPDLEGDQIFNGAMDNATGISALVELAQAFVSLEEPQSRSILLMAVTAEEQGLLGSAYYAANPVYPLEKTVAAINMDALNIIGPMNDVSIVGFGNSALDEYLIEAALHQGRVVNPEPRPEAGSYYRSDHFNFAKVGVPALYANPGRDHVEYGAEWSQQWYEQYLANHYHQPSDEYDPSWDLSGAIDDLRLYFRVAYRLANETTFPNWSEGTEFKAIRDEMMAGR